MYNKCAWFFLVIAMIFATTHFGSTNDKTLQRGLPHHTTPVLQKKALIIRPTVAIPVAPVVKVALQEKVSQIPLSDAARLWMQQFPPPRDRAERTFLELVAYVHESNDESDFTDVNQVALLFLGQGAAFDDYLQIVLGQLLPSADQRERNFIYAFAQTARPESSFSSQVQQDLQEMYLSGRSYSPDNATKLSEIWMAQSDVTFEDKYEVLEQFMRP